MPRQRKNDILIPFLAVVADVLSVMLAFVCSYILRFDSPLVKLIPVTKGYPPMEAYVLGGTVVALIWVLMFQRQGVYRVRRDTDLSLELFRIVRQVSFGMLVVLSLTFFFRAFSYSRIVFAFIWVLAMLFMFVGRSAVLAYEKRLYRKGRELRNVLLLGSNAMAQDPR